MIAREAVLNDPEVVRLLKTRFVPLAVDNVGNPNLTTDERAFLNSFDSGVKVSTIGFSAFTAGGKKLASGGDFTPGPVLAMLKKALAEFTPEPSLVLPKTGQAAAGGPPSPPEGGLILYVTWKALGGFTPDGGAATCNGKYDRVVGDALGADRLWVRKDEALALAKGEFPESLKRRIDRVHVRHVFGGAGKTFDVSVRDGKLAGAFSPDPGSAAASVLGRLEARDGRVTRFDLMIKGSARRIEDHGFSANLRVVPEGMAVPAVLFFELSDSSDAFARALPTRSKDPSYLK